MSFSEPRPRPQGLPVRRPRGRAASIVASASGPYLNASLSERRVQSMLRKQNESLYDSYDFPNPYALRLKLISIGARSGPRAPHADSLVGSVHAFEGGAPGLQHGQQLQARAAGPARRRGRGIARAPLGDRALLLLPRLSLRSRHYRSGAVLRGEARRGSGSSCARGSACASGSGRAARASSGLSCSSASTTSR